MKTNKCLVSKLRLTYIEKQQNIHVYKRKLLSGTIKTTYYGFTTYDNKGLQRDALTTVFYYFITSNF